MYADRQQTFIQTKEAKINTVKTGKGEAILLLHGYPQTHFMWHKIMPLLAQDFTVIATDLRGYGDSSKPKDINNCANYAKKAMAADQIEVMSQLGYESFYLVGHDRGARVAYRLALDYPERVKKLALLDIVPTYFLYNNTDREFATAYYHWFFLIQPYPLPETLIGANSEYFLRTCLQSWSKNFSAFCEDALAEYIRCFNNPETIHASCQDYRASATIDLDDDRADRDRKITCPLLVLWGDRGAIGRKYDVLAIWREIATNVSGKAIDCGHFLPEEAPDETYTSLKEFLVN
ncbi:MAG: alpha/beta fold hydrolase [Xenococcaceae cyanobacterium]